MFVEQPLASPGSANNLTIDCIIYLVSYSQSKCFLNFNKLSYKIVEVLYHRVALPPATLLIGSLEASTETELIDIRPYIQVKVTILVQSVTLMSNLS